MRTAGSAKLESAAVQECIIHGQGPVSATELEVIQVMPYGVDGPVTAATTICESGDRLSARTCCTNDATGVNMPLASAGTHPVSITISVTLPLGANRGGLLPLQR